MFIESMQQTPNFSVYEDTQLVTLLLEVICKRREKVLPYDRAEIEFVLNNLSGIDPPASRYLKYFLSHICITFNRTKSSEADEYTMNLFQLIQNKCMLLLSEEDTMKVTRGALIYTDFYNCVINSKYTTMYTLMDTDICYPRKSKVYLELTKRKMLNIGELDNLRCIVSLINDTNFYLFKEILGFYDWATILTKENFVCFYNNLQDDYLEDKIDVLIRMLITNWFNDEVERKNLVNEIITSMSAIPRKLGYDLYRNLKMIQFLSVELTNQQALSLTIVLMSIIDEINEPCVLGTNKSKLHERIIVVSSVFSFIFVTIMN